MSCHLSAADRNEVQMQGDRKSGRDDALLWLNDRIGCAVEAWIAVEMEEILAVAGTLVSAAQIALRLNPKGVAEGTERERVGGRYTFIDTAGSIDFSGLPEDIEVYFEDSGGPMSTLVVMLAPAVELRVRETTTEQSLPQVEKVLEAAAQPQPAEDDDEPDAVTS
jgi:hypothetical protein